MTTEAAVERTSKPPVLKHSEMKFFHTSFMVEFSTVRHNTAFHICFSLLTHKTGMHTQWQKNKQNVISKHMNLKHFAHAFTLHMRELLLWCGAGFFPTNEFALLDAAIYLFICSDTNKATKQTHLQLKCTQQHPKPQQSDFVFLFISLSMPGQV